MFDKPKAPSPMKEAYLDWQATFSLEKGEGCQCMAHYKLAKDEQGYVREVYRTDDDVCARERAWRRYVRLRDNNPRFPFARPERALKVWDGGER